MGEHLEQPGFEYVSGGTLAPDAPSYVERQADHELFSSLKSGETCYVLNSRQMGKSSLCVRTIQKLRDARVRTVFCDLTKFGGRNLTAEQWYAALVSEMGRELGLRDEFLAHWKENLDLPPVQRLFGALVEVGLKEPSPLVVFIDEIDVTLSLPFSADEFFAAIRQCYVGRATDERLKQLSFCLLGTATPADLIQDTRVSPFNIGKRVELRDFSSSEVEPLAAGLGDRKLLDRVLYWTGGHPYLTQRLCQAVSKSGLRDVDQVCSDLFLTHAAQESDDNLAFVRNRLLKSEADVASLLDLYRHLRQGKKVADDETNPLCAILKLSGVAKVENGHLKVRNRIYEHVFDRDWVETHLPDAEKRRQKEAYRKGLLRAALWGGAAVLAFAVVGGIAISSAIHSRAARMVADEQRNRADRLLYRAEMRLAQQAWESDNFEQARDSLEATKDSRYKGFEWFYWQRVLHPRSVIFSLAGHADGVSSVAFAPDGKLLATGSLDKTARLWDAANGTELLALEGHSDEVTSIAFSPDGKRLATGSSDMTAKLWDVATGNEIATFKGHTAQLLSVAFSPDGTRLATASVDKTVKVWDAASGDEILTLTGHKEGVACVAFSPDGSRLATASYDKSGKVWDASTGAAILTMNGHTAETYVVSFSPDGRRLATASWDKTARLWDATTGRELLEFGGHAGGVVSLAFSPDGRSVITGSFNGVVKLWDAFTGGELLTLRGHTDAVLGISFSKDGKRLATASMDKKATVWNAAAGPDEFFSLAGHTDRVSAVAFSPKGNRIATASFDNSAKAWDHSTSKELGAINGHTDALLDVAFSRDGERLATASLDKTAKVWNATGGFDEVLSLRGHTSGVTGVAFSPDGRLVATTSYDKTARLWDARSGAMVLALKGHTNGVQGVAWSPDGKRLATASMDKTARIWDASTGRAILTLKGHNDWVWAVTFSSDGRRVATASYDKSARVWDAATGIELLRLKGHSSPVGAVSFSPDGNRIATASDDKTARIWDAKTGSELLTLRGHTGAVIDTVFSQDGLRVATASFDKTVRVWEAATDAQVAKWERQERDAAERIRQRLAVAEALQKKRERDALAKISALAPEALTQAAATSTWDFSTTPVDPRWVIAKEAWAQSEGALRSMNGPDLQCYAYIPIPLSGDFDLWTEFEASSDMHLGAWSLEDTQTYNYSGYIAFIGGYANTKSVIRYDSSPSMPDEGNLAKVSRGVDAGRHTIQFSRSKGHLWLLYDGEVISAVKDPNPIRQVNRVGFLGGWGGNQSVFKVRLRSRPLNLAKALDDFNKLIASDPQGDSPHGLSRFKTLLRLDAKRANSYGQKLADSVFRNSAENLNELAWSIVDPAAKLYKPDVQIASGFAQRAVQLSRGKDPNMLDTLAWCLFLQGDVDKAISVQEKAVALALKPASAVPPDTAKEMRNTLARFKAKKSAGKE